MDKTYSLVVRYYTKGWGSTDDLSKRHRLEDVLDECLQRTQNGECDGGDIGSGTINIYLEGITDPDRACQDIVAALTFSGDIEGAFVARSNRDEEEIDMDEPPYCVLWPKDFVGEFGIL